MIVSYLDPKDTPANPHCSTVEVAVVDVKRDNEPICTDLLQCAEHLLARCEDYLKHETVESPLKPGRYIWMIHWRKHSENPIIFRSTPEYKQWRQLMSSL